MNSRGIFVVAVTALLCYCGASVHADVKVVETGDRVDRMVFTPDGKLLVVSNGAGGITLWDTATWKQTKRFEGKSKATLTDLALSPDGKWVVVGGGKPWMDMWNLSDGTYREIPVRYGLRYEFSPNGEKLAVHGEAKTKGVVVIDVESGKQSAFYALQSNPTIMDLTWTRDGSTIVCDAIYRPDTQLLRFLNPSTEKMEPLTTALKVKGGTRVAHSPDGKLRAYNQAKFVVEDVASGKLLWQVEHGLQAQYCLFTPDNKRLVSARQNLLRVYDASTGEVVGEIKRSRTQEEKMFSQLAISPDGQHLVNGSGNVFEVIELSTINPPAPTKPATNAHKGEGKKPVPDP